MNNILLKLKFTNHLFNIMCEQKEEYLEKVCVKYNCTLDKLKELLQEELSKSDMNMGACNTAVDFIIVDTNTHGDLNVDTEEQKERNIRKLIKANILGSAIYYANELGIDPTYKGN